MKKLLNEFKRRKMFRPLVAYASVSFILLQIFQVVLPALQIPEWFMSFLVWLIILGFPITFFLSWVYDITPEGIMKTSPVIEENPKSNGHSNKSRKILLPITGFLTIIGGAFWIWYSLGDISSGSELDLHLGIKKSIAILNFENFTGNKDGDFFCAALTEQIRAALSKLGRLEVASRLISERMGQKNADTIDNLYGELDYYVEGSLSRVADNKNINISLINAKNHKTEWARLYTFAENEIVHYKDTIINNIAINLDVDYEPLRLLSEKGGSNNADEFKILGRGIYQFDHNNFVAALSSFNSFLNLQSNNFEALYHKANTLVKLNRTDEAIDIYNNLIFLSTSHNHFDQKWLIKDKPNVNNSLIISSNNDT